MTQKTERKLPDDAASLIGKGPRIITTAELFGGDEEVVLLHKGSPYRLRITRQDKLILTK